MKVSLETSLEYRKMLKITALGKVNVTTFEIHFSWGAE